MMEKRNHGALQFLAGLRAYASTLPSFRRCQFIDGEPVADDACKCGLPVRGRSPYCRDHHKICWQTRPTFLPQG